VIFSVKLALLKLQIVPLVEAYLEIQLLIVTAYKDIMRETTIVQVKFKSLIEINNKFE
jgi:hypothetical protein